MPRRAAAAILDRTRTFVGAGAYVLRYVVEPEGAIVIIRVWHSREERI